MCFVLRFTATAVLALAMPLGARKAATAAPPEARRPNVVVILADDLGYADVGVQGVAEDVRTPNLDRLAREGIRCRAGYVTAPQCSPSRAGLMTGRYQQRFGLDSNTDTPLPMAEVTLAERLREAGYVTAQVGKWHLEPAANSQRWIQNHLPGAGRNPQGRVRIPLEQTLPYLPGAQGFDRFFCGAAQHYYANYGLKSAGPEPAQGPASIEDSRFRIDVQTEAAVAFLEEPQDAPFFLYVGYYAPHVPLEATEEYLKRFPGPMSDRRRHALAMMAGVDDGVGRILETLARRQLDQTTLIFFASDNGAPLQGKKELPVEVGGATWDGSLNDPWVGEKGMLTEGGIRVPYLIRWRGALSPGIYDLPVSTLDIAATALAAAGLPHDPVLDGVDLVPFLTGVRPGDPHDALYWRFWTQSAIRSGRWKYLRAGDRAEYLFDLESETHERTNRLESHPRVAAELRGRLEIWAKGLHEPGVPSGDLRRGEDEWYATHLGLPKTVSNARPRQKDDASH